MTATLLRGTRSLTSTPAAGTSFALDASYDWVAVDLCMRGDLDQALLHTEDRAEVVRRLNAQGLNDHEIERRTGITGRTVLRIRKRLHIGSASAPGVNSRALVR